MTPLPRRRPQMVAQQLATLSLASGGRVVFGAGLGGPREEFERFGEDGEPRVRAGKLDEGLELVARLLAGERVRHRGAHYAADDVTLAPLPVRRVPFWIGGMSPPALRRAARWDGWLGDTSDRERNLCPPEEIAARAATLRAAGAGPDFDVCFIGYSHQADLASYAAAGVTWWIENVHGDPGPVLRRVEQGPPAETLLT